MAGRIAALYRRCRAVALCGGLLLSAPLAVGDDAATLWALLSAQAQISGAFSQEIVSEEGETLERSSGRFAVLRPGFFRWEIDYPDRQLLLVNGDDLWHYDIDLATATRRDAKAQGEFTPLELLTGDRDSLAARFSVERIDGERYRLLPRFAQASFTAIEVSWSQEQLAGMAIRDRGGQLIRIDLQPAVNPPSLEAQDFELELPDDVEVFDAGGT